MSELLTREETRQMLDDLDTWEWISLFAPREVLGAYADGDLLTRAEWEATAIVVICKHNTPDALTTSLFLSPMDGNEIPEGEYALVRVGDREDS